MKARARKEYADMGMRTNIWQLKQYESYCSPDKLRVMWLPEGTQFKIEEYDGSESVILATDIKWHEA